MVEIFYGGGDMFVWEVIVCFLVVDERGVFFMGLMWVIEERVVFGVVLNFWG